MASVTRNPRPLFVTTLPAGYDGQEVFYQSTTAGTGGGASNSMADVGAVWHLRYRDAGASGKKWEAVGASPIAVYTAATVTISSATPAADTAQRVVVPLAGDYYCQVNVSYYGSNTGGNKIVDVFADYAGTPAARVSCFLNLAEGFMSNAGTVGTVTAATSIEPRLSKEAGSSNASFRNRSFSITPVRVG